MWNLFPRYLVLVACSLLPLEVVQVRVVRERTYLARSEVRSLASLAVVGSS